MKYCLYNLKQYEVERVFSWCVFGILLASIALPVVRYVSYLLPFGAVLILLAVRRVHIPEQLYVFVLMLISGIILLPLANSEGLKDLYLIFVGVSVTLVGYNLTVSWWTLFITNIIGTMIFTACASGFNAFSFRFLSSTGVTESTFSFIFGLLAISAVFEKKWFRFVVSSLATIITLKRIAVLGVIVCAILLILPRKFSYKFLRPMPMIIINFILIILTIGFTKGLFDSFIHNITGMSSNAFTMGRRLLYFKPVMVLIEDPIRFLFVGIGPGETYQSLSWITKSNLHNDLLKIIVEYGGIVFMAAVTALYRSCSFKYRVFGMYTNILFLSDNVLIYPFYAYFLWLISANTIYENEDIEGKCILNTHASNDDDKPKTDHVQPVMC